MKLTSAHSGAGTAGRPFFAVKSGLLLTAGLLLAAGEAGAASRTYRMFRFAPTKITQESNEIQLSEFTFSLNGVLLNLNDRNGTGVNVIPVAVTAGGQDPEGGEGPMKVTDGLPPVTGDNNSTKWFNGDAINVPLDFDFGEGVQVTVDGYNFATGNDSGDYGNRTPVSWVLYGSNDGENWDTLDTRSDAVVANANNTYQSGWTIPEAVTPVITSFGYDFTATAAIVKNGTPVILQWSTLFADPTGVSIAPLPGIVEDIGTREVIPPANATTSFTLTAAKASPPLSATATLPIRSVAGGSSTYQYVRFTVTSLRPGTRQGLVQISEFQFYNSGLPISEIPLVSNPGGSNAPDAGEGVNMLVDSNWGSKWLDANNQPVIFDFGAPVTFDGYEFITGNDAPERDPVSWTLEGSNDQQNWTLVENVNFTYPTPIPRVISTQPIPLPGASVLPLVNQFVGDATTLISGQPLRLTWATSLATSVTISNGVTASAVSGSTVVSPTADTTYTLTATSASGGVTTASFTVKVIPPPAITTIDYADFSAAGPELGLLRSAAVTSNRLRVVPETQGQAGESWFRYRQNVGAGFETTFGLSLNQTTPNPSYLAADGLAFVIQNSVTGSASQASGGGEDGLAANALNIKFDTFGTVDDASALEVRAGTEVLQRVVLFKEIGVDLYGLFPGTTTFNYTTATNAASPPYQIRIVYVPHDLDIYLDGVAVVQNLDVDLAAIGAVDSTGFAYTGFTSRTGGNVENSDITNWHLRSGDFSALAPFGLVKSKFIFADPTLPPSEISLVWNSTANKTYRVTGSANLTNWEPVQTGEPGIQGQTKVRVPLNDSGTIRFYRVEEEP